MRLSTVTARARRVARAALSSDQEQEELPLYIQDWEHRRSHAPLIERLTDEELTMLNRLLPWNCFTIDSRDRRFGNWVRKGKRDVPLMVPDPRTVALHERFDLSDKHVLELGCFEGVHTIGLCQLAERVTAVDVHIANVVKTMVRCGFYGHRPIVFPCNVEEWQTQFDDLRADVVHHVGVLYHLRDPVKHLHELAGLTGVGMLLDTSVATREDTLETGVYEGVEYQFKRYQEGSGVLAGAYEHARWLLLDHIVSLLGDLGFADVAVTNERVERNGTRVTIYAGRA